MPSEATQLSEDGPYGLEEKTTEPVPPRNKTIILFTSIHTFIFPLWTFVFAVSPIGNKLDLIAFATWTCFLALVSTFMVFMPKFPKHYSPYTLKVVENWVTSVLSLQASAYFILAGSLAARFGVRHTFSTKKICSRVQDIWIAFLVAGLIHSMCIYMLYIIPQGERNAIRKAEAEKAEAEMETI